jgi:hypothetical protein
MRAGPESSAAYGIQLTADCELLRLFAQLVVVEAGETMFPSLAPFFLARQRARELALTA